MSLRIVSAAILCLGVGACATTPPVQMVWARADMQRMQGNPELQQQFELDRTVCLGETQKAAVGAPIIYQGPGIGGAIAAGIADAQRSGALMDVAKGCMAQRGYLYMSAAEAEARLKAAEEQKAAASKAKPVRRPSPSRPAPATG